MFCGNVSDAKRSFNELKKSLQLRDSITAKNKATWKSHKIADTPAELRKFLGFEEDDYRDGNAAGN
jgi:hypothetical protein